MSIPLTVISPAETAACCAPLTTQPLSMEQAEQVAPLLKALADPVRLRLLSLVASRPGGEACICDLNEAFDLSQPTISHHMKVLHEAGLVDRDKRGVWVYYRIRPQALSALSALIGCPVPQLAGAGIGPGRPLTVKEIVAAVPVGQSTVPEHLRQLAAVRFVLAENHGTSRLYRINDACVTCFPTAADLVMGNPHPSRYEDDHGFNES